MRKKVIFDIELSSKINETQVVIYDHAKKCFVAIPKLDFLAPLQKEVNALKIELEKQNQEISKLKSIVKQFSIIGEEE